MLLEEGVCCDQCVLLAALCQPLPCFLLHSKAGFACYSRCFTVHGVLKATILKWFAIPFSSGPHFVEMTRPSWVALDGMAHSFTELDKAVVHVIIG